VGGKNASLGEMVRNLTAAGVQVPDGFATTADAYRHFISDGGLAEMINAELAALDTDDLHPPGTAGDCEVEAVCHPGPSVTGSVNAALSSRKDAPLDKRSVPAPYGCCARLPRCISSTSGDVLVADMTDPRLGADHETGCSHRDQSRWPDLPCGDHCA
jgi:hypothetical protein